MRFALLLTLLLPLRASALDFPVAQGRALFAAGTRPGSTFLVGGRWLLVAGTAVHDATKCAWSPGPLGVATDGAFGTITVLGKLRRQPKLELEFRAATPATPANVLLRTSDAEPGKGAFTYLPLGEDAKSVSFTVTDELAFSPPEGAPTGATALYECRGKAPDHLTCQGTYQPAEGSPPLAPLATLGGKPVYYALFQRTAESTGSPAVTIPPSQLPPPPAPRGATRGYRCVMHWAPKDGKPGSTEIMSFTLLSAPARLGRGSMVGVGTSIETSHPDVFDRVVVVKAVEDETGTTFGIAKADVNQLDGSYDIAEKAVNAAGLPMVGSIKIPRGGGDSQVQYPPGPSQSLKSYQASLPDSPHHGQCEEKTVAEPGDPYARGAGGI